MSQLLKKHSILLSITSMMALAGCGGAGNKDGSSSTDYSTNAQMSAVQDLSVEERAIATRICYAYQSKSSSFRGQSYTSGQFKFAIDSKNCVDASANYSVNAVLSVSGNSIAFTPTTTDKPFQQTIQTAQVGFLAQLCTKIQNNQSISNTANDGASKVQIRFFKDTFDSYTLRYFSLDAATSSMKIVSAETFKVRTQFNLTAGQILGLDESYSMQQTCGTTNKFSQFNQKFSSYSN